MTQMDGGDAADVARARAGDEEAFRRLVERHSSRLFRVAYRMTGNEMDADDVVQESFLKAYRQLDRFEARSSFGSWLHRIAVHSACDLLRARRRRKESPADPSSESEGDALDSLPAPSPSPDRLAQSAEVERHVQTALQRLTAQERTAFVLRHFEHMSTKEIGQVLEIEPGAVKNSVFRAVRKLREALWTLAAPRAGTEVR